MGLVINHPQWPLPIFLKLIPSAFVTPIGMDTVHVEALVLLRGIPSSHCGDENGQAIFLFQDSLPRSRTRNVAEFDDLDGSTAKKMLVLAAYAQIDCGLINYAAEF